MASETTKPPDEISWRILRELQLDGRVSFTELGRRVGLSTPAVAERVRNLEAAGVIRGYRAEIDLAKVGLPMLAVVRMSAVGDVLTRMPGVRETRTYAVLEEVKSTTALPL